MHVESLNNKEMFAQARNIAEPEFANILKKRGFSNVFQGTKADDVNHCDVFGKFNGVECKFDVKDLTAKYLTSKNYNMSKDMYDDITAHPNKYKNHYVACRLYSNNKPTGKYSVIKTTVAKDIATEQIRKDGSHYYFFNIDKCMKNAKDYRILD